MFDNYDAGTGEGRVTGIFVFDPPCEGMDKVRVSSSSSSCRVAAHAHCTEGL